MSIAYRIFEYMLLVKCHSNILRFYVTNKKLRNSETHSKCHHLLLSKVILSQKRHLRQIKLEHDSIK